MIYEVSEKKSEAVRVELKELGEGQYEIAIDGRTVQVDAVKSGRTIYSIIEDGRQYEASVDEQGAHGFNVLVAGRLFHLDAVDERSKLLAQQASYATSGPQTVEAEMPGKVVKIAVSVGQEVAEGESIIVLEAMKMENDINSPVEGVITEILVTEGQTVETGAGLFVVTPPDADA